MKSFYQSKTIWFNIATIIMLLIDISGVLIDSKILSSNIIEYLLIFNAIGNVILRYFTDKPIRPVNNGSIDSMDERPF